MAARNRRIEKKQRTREAILRAAAAEFAELGLARGTTAGVARRADLAHGTVFLHFKTREALIEAVFESKARELAALLNDRCERAQDLREVMRSQIQVLAEYELIYTVLLREGAAVSEVLRATLLGLHSTMAAHLAAAAFRDRVRGRLRQMPLPLLVNGWLGLLHQYLGQRELVSPGRSVLAARGPDLMEHYLGLVTP